MRADVLQTDLTQARREREGAEREDRCLIAEFYLVDRGLLLLDK